MAPVPLHPVLCDNAGELYNVLNLTTHHYKPDHIAHYNPHITLHYRKGYYYHPGYYHPPGYIRHHTVLQFEQQVMEQCGVN